jgi:hypothetical protein
MKIVIYYKLFDIISYPQVCFPSPFQERVDSSAGRVRFLCFEILKPHPVRKLTTLSWKGEGFEPTQIPPLRAVFVYYQPQYKRIPIKYKYYGCPISCPTG